MGRSPSPAEIFDRAVDEGNRRLDQSLLELVSTSFIAGFTIVFGILYGASIGPERIAFLTVAVTAGNFAGGLGLVTFAHVTQGRAYATKTADPAVARSAVRHEPVVTAVRIEMREKWAGANLNRGYGHPKAEGYQATPPARDPTEVQSD